jgi:hypothetical protein
VAFSTTMKGNRIVFPEVVNSDPETVGGLDQRGASASRFQVREEARALRNVGSRPSIPVIWTVLPTSFRRRGTPGSTLRSSDNQRPRRSRQFDAY